MGTPAKASNSLTLHWVPGLSVQGNENGDDIARKRTIIAVKTYILWPWRSIFKEELKQVMVSKRNRR